MHVAGGKHKSTNAMSHRPVREDELRRKAEGREEVVRRLEEFMDGEIDTMWVSAEEEKACTGFCNRVFHSFYVSFLIF